MKGRELSVTVSTITKSERRTKARLGEPLILFTVNLVIPGMVLMSVKGWRIGIDHVVQVPMPYSFSRKSLDLVQVARQFKERLRDILLQHPDVIEYLGREPIEKIVTVKGESKAVPLEGLDDDCATHETQ